MKIPLYLKVLFLLLPVILAAMGRESNHLVTSLNGGLMPVEVPAGFSQLQFPPGSKIDDDHKAADSRTVLRILDDRIERDEDISSIGDEFIETGYLLAFPFLGLAAIFVILKRWSLNSGIR